MRGLYLDGGRLALRDDLPEPNVPDGWSLVEVHRAGICRTDQALLSGYMDFTGIPGHEFVGIALDGPLAGRRVVGEINAGCGECPTCLQGDSRHCEARAVLGIAGLQGAFAERIALPRHNLHTVPDGIDDEAATFVEPLAAALHIGDDVDLAEHRRVLVAGDGKLGLLCAAALSYLGCEVTLCGRHPARAELLGIPIEFVTGWLEHEPEDFDPIAPFDLAVEATGDASVLPRLLPLVRARGTIVLKTTSEAETVIDLSPLVVAEQRLIGSRCGRFAPALEMLARHDFDVRPLISARYPLEQAERAFDHAASHGTLKVLIEVKP